MMSAVAATPPAVLGRPVREGMRWLVELSDSAWTQLAPRVGERVLVEDAEQALTVGHVAHIGGRYVVALTCAVVGRRVRVRRPRLVEAA